MSESKTKYTRLARAAQVLNDKVNILQAEVAGLVQVLYVLAQQNGGSIVLTDKELAEAPQGAALQTFRDQAKEEFVFVAKAPEPTEEHIAAPPAVEGDDSTPASSESMTSESGV